jgi:5-methylthioribose kinase
MAPPAEPARIAVLGIGQTNLQRLSAFGARPMMEKNHADLRQGTAAARFVGGARYAPLTEARLRALVRSVAVCCELLQGDPADWQIREVGDGNLNLVFIVTSGAAGVVVKQALPYVRLVGESWPLPLDRAHFEREALRMQAAHVPMHVPRVYHFDVEQAAIVMAYLSPHIILRKGLIRRITYPHVAEHLSTFMAQTLFRSSDLSMPAAAKKTAQALFCHNAALCKISEDLIFTDPYRVAPLNRWTSPELDTLAAAFRADAALKVAVQELKWAFLSRGEALLHGDLHTGSVMVTETDTRAIDPEFAFFGPIGFDVGALLANLMLSYFAQDGHPGDPDTIAVYRRWLLDTVEAVWTLFETKFVALWRQSAAGDAFVAELFSDPAGAEALDRHRQATMARIFADSMGFAGAKMARRILGLAHVEDLESIGDPRIRSACETKALHLARNLMLDRAAIGDIKRLRARIEAAALENP